MRKKKNVLDSIKEIRNSWEINPRTRIQDNDLKNKKKRRQAEEKLIKGGNEE